MLLRHRLARLASAHMCFVLMPIEVDIASALGPIKNGIRAHKAAAALQVVAGMPIGLPNLVY